MKWTNIPVSFAVINGFRGSTVKTGKPKRCAKCKDERWEKGKLSYREQDIHRIIRQRFGYWFHGWSTEENAKRFLASRPSEQDLMLIADPMSRVGAIDFKHESDKYELFKCKYELQRKNLQWLMERDNIPYGSNEPKSIEMGYLAINLGLKLPELCDAVKYEHPEYSNEDIKAWVLKCLTEELTDDDRRKELEERIEYCWPVWLIK